MVITQNQCPPPLPSSWRLRGEGSSESFNPAIRVISSGTQPPPELSRDPSAKSHLSSMPKTFLTFGRFQGSFQELGQRPNEYFLYHNYSLTLKKLKHYIHLSFKCLFISCSIPFVSLKFIKGGTVSL